MNDMRRLIEAVENAGTDEKPVMLPRGKKVVLQVEESDYLRGLIVEAKEGGGYDVEYWYKEPSNIMPAEVKIDGKSVSKDANKVYLGFHPEMGDEDKDTE